MRTTNNNTLNIDLEIWILWDIWISKKYFINIRGYLWCMDIACAKLASIKSTRNRKEKVELLLNFPLIFARNKMRNYLKDSKAGWDRKLDEFPRDYINRTLNWLSSANFLNIRDKSGNIRVAAYNLKRIESINVRKW